MLTTLEFAPDAAPEQIADQVRAVWRDSKVIHITGVKPDGDLRDYYWRFFEDVGVPMALAEDATIGDRDSQRTGSYWAEVRYDPAVPDAYRHSANAQPLHTDGAYTSPDSVQVEASPNAVGTGFLGCVAMPANGGATTFIDAVDVYNTMHDEAPELLEQLQATDVPHARSGDRKVAKVIEMKGGLPVVNWNYYCVDADAGNEVKSLGEQFFRFLERSPGIAANLQRVKLSPGDAVIWKDDYVLHGRDSFDPERTSARFLWKTSLLIDA
ncbi:TauD/TfdA family dioxygenase [Sphingomonas sp.]|uniref:TauD/TfdA family dioxygenase n=1 Tax=Sphingomonas sp. TaxID=28214 RepID=UPI0035BC3B7F